MLGCFSWIAVVLDLSPHQLYTRFMKHKRLIILGAVLFSLLVLAQAGLDYYFYRQTQEAHDTTTISLITKAVDGLHEPAPVDPRTGDSYFPEARLYVPASNNYNASLIYNYVDVDGRPELSITGKQFVNAAQSKLWSAYSNNTKSNTKAFEAVFAQVPNLQACARGVQLFTTPRTEATVYTKRFEVTDSKNRTWYAYTEPTCKQDIQPLVTQLRSIKAY